MTFPRSFRLVLGAALIFFATVVCSTGYITPDSLAATAEAAAADAAPATAFYVPPTQTPAADPLITSTPEEGRVTPSPTPTETLFVTAGAPVLYSAQAGDTLPALALRFGVTPEEISSPQDI